MIDRKVPKYNSLWSGTGTVVDFCMPTTQYLIGRSRFTKQRQSLPQVVPGLCHAGALAGNVQFGTEGDVSIAFTLYNCRP